MASKQGTGARVMDLRPGYSSGVLAAKADIGLFESLEDAIVEGDVRLVSDHDWMHIGINSVTRGPSLKFRNTDLGEYHSLIAMYSEDLMAAANINFRSGIVGSDYVEAVTASVNKSSFFDRLSQNGFALPFVESVNNGLIGIEEILKDSNLREVIVKPSTGTGSIGVFRGRTDDPELFKEQLRVALRSMSDQENLVIMGVLDSGETIKEFAINSIIVNSKPVRIFVHAKVEQSSVAPFRDFIIATHVPSREEQQKIDAVLKAAIRALNVEFGVLQLEVRPDHEGNWIPIDVALRPDGGLMPEMIRAEAGVDIRLAQVYAHSGLVGLLTEYLAASRSGEFPATAIGAFYSQEFDADLIAKLVKAASEPRTVFDDVVACYFSAEASNMGVSPPELQAAFCIGADSPDRAFSRLRSVASEFGLNSGLKWY